jgi:hypothetical protein
MRSIIDQIRTKSWLSFILLWLALSLVSCAWALSTPLGGSPDEPAHIIKAASVARGQFLGSPTDEAAVTSVKVPASLAGASAWTCFAFKPDVQAACLKPVPDDARLRSAKTSAGLYNPVYYAMVGWPSLLTDSAKVAVFGMRTVSAVLSSLFLALTLWVLLLFRRPVIAGVGFLAVATPMVFFLNSAVNPNSLEIAAGAALMSLLLLLARGPSLRHPGLALCAVAVSGVLLANARGISPLWMAMIAVIAIIAAPWQTLKSLLLRPSVLLALAALVIGALFAGWWILRTNTLSSMGSFPGAGETSPSSAFVTMLTKYSFDPGLIGVFGWLDTAAPAIAFVIWPTLGAAIFVLAIVTARGRLLWSVIAATAVFMLVPPIVQAASVEKSGFIWQGRYTLVAYVALVVTATVVSASATPRFGIERVQLTMRFVFSVGGAFIIGQLWAMLFVIKRYSVGEAATWPALFRQPLWTPPGGILLWPGVALLGFAIVTGVWLVWVRGSSRTLDAAIDEHSALAVATDSAAR